MTAHRSPDRYVNYSRATGLYEVHSTCKVCGGPIDYVRRSPQGKLITYCSPQCVNDANERKYDAR